MLGNLAWAASAVLVLSCAVEQEVLIKWIPAGGRVGVSFVLQAKSVWCVSWTVGAQSQSITDTINNLNPTCKPLVLGVVGNCTTELVAAANAVGVSFPPKEGETASQEAVQAYADTNPNIGFK